MQGRPSLFLCRCAEQLGRFDVPELCRYGLPTIHGGCHEVVSFPAWGRSGSAFTGSAIAAPLPYLNTPFETPNSAANAVITAYNAAVPGAAYTTACTGTTTATCQGLKIAASYTGLTTRRGRYVYRPDCHRRLCHRCFHHRVSGHWLRWRGQPPGDQHHSCRRDVHLPDPNTHASSALNATVVTACLVFN